MRLSRCSLALLTACVGSGSAQQASARSVLPAAIDAGAPLPMSAQSLADKIRSTRAGMLKAREAHDTDALVSFYAPDAVVKQAGLPEVIGRAALKARLQSRYARLPDQREAVTRVFVHDHTVATEGVATGTDKATGRAVGEQTLVIDTFDDDGAVKEEHAYADLATERKQLDPNAKPGSFRPPPPLPTGQPEEYASTGSSDEQLDMQVVAAMFDALSPLKADAFGALLTDDAILDDMGDPGLLSGKAAVTQDYETASAIFPGLTRRGVPILAAGRFVVAEGIWNGGEGSGSG